MSDERLKEIVDDIISGRAVKITNEEFNEIDWNYIVIPPNCVSVTLIFKRKNNKNILWNLLGLILKFGNKVLL